ncbi:MAG: hypothetical protein IK078_02255 [Lachnospiraceae bacterium]|nr:hypothetical protein [Lachnospiraceae bacterium]
MEYIILFVVLFLMLVIYFVRNVVEEKNRKIAFEKSLRTDFGKHPAKRYPEGRMEAMKRHAGRYIPKGSGGSGKLSFPKGAAIPKDLNEWGISVSFVDEITCNDLDLDGLFQRIDRCYSAAGEETLYRILRNPVFDQKELVRRHELIDYFMKNEDQRVQLQMYFAMVGKTGKYSALDYLDSVTDLELQSNRRHIAVLAFMAAAVAIAFFSQGLGVFLLICLIIYNFLTYFKEKRRIDPYITTFGYFLRILDAAKELEDMDLSILSENTERIRKSRECFRGFANFAFFLTGQNDASGSPADIVLEYLRMGLHLNLIKFNTMLEQVQKNQDAIETILWEMGYIEAMISAAEFAKSLPAYCFGQLEESSRKLTAQDICHPLIDDPVSNDISLGKSLLLTGSNASGKSTFLKTIAIAQILTQTIGIVPAKVFQTDFYRVYTSMALRDDLSGGRSYFIVEIESLKRILDAAAEKEKYPVMCFIDEVLRGTNTVERIAASTEILSGLDNQGVFTFAATHDIELTSLLEGQFTNCHFTETVKEGDVQFSYKLQQGRAQSRNAIRLLGLIGYDEEIVDRATKRAEEFIETGEWN